MKTDLQARVPRLAWVAALVAGLVAAIGATLVVIDLRSPEDRPAPGTLEAEQFVRDYVAALNAADRDRLAQLRGEPADSSGVSQHLNAFGGRGFADVAVVLNDQIGDTYSWQVKATEAGEPITLTVVTEWSGTHWSVTVDGPSR